MTDAKTLDSSHRVDIVMGIVFSVLTCGLYNVYWNYRQMLAMNALLGREEYSFLKWAILTLVTCGIYHIYYEYRMGSDLHAWLSEHGHAVDSNLSMIGLGLSLIGLTVVADAIYQREINKLT
jgi:hypothetical protein